MFLIGTRRYSRLRQALGMSWFDGRQEHPAGEPAPIEEIHALLADSPALALAASPSSCGSWCSSPSEGEAVL